MRRRLDAAAVLGPAVAAVAVLSVFALPRLQDVADHRPVDRPGASAVCVEPLAGGDLTPDQAAGLAGRADADPAARSQLEQQVPGLRSQGGGGSTGSGSSALGALLRPGDAAEGVPQKPGEGPRANGTGTTGTAGAGGAGSGGSRSGGNRSGGSSSGGIGAGAGSGGSGRGGGGTGSSGGGPNPPGPNTGAGRTPTSDRVDPQPTVPPQQALDELKRSPDPVKGSTLPTLLILLAAVAATVGLGILATRLLAGRDRRAATGAGVKPDEQGTVAAARAARTRHDPEAEIRLWFTAGLLRLDRLGILVYDPTRTSRWIGRRLRSTTFPAVAFIFDEVVYGRRPATTADADAVRDGFDAVVAECTTAAAPSGPTPRPATA